MIFALVIVFLVGAIYLLFSQMFGTLSDKLGPTIPAENLPTWNKIRNAWNLWPLWTILATIIMVIVYLVRQGNYEQYM